MLECVIIKEKGFYGYSFQHGSLVFRLGDWPRGLTNLGQENPPSNSFLALQDGVAKPFRVENSLKTDGTPINLLKTDGTPIYFLPGFDILCWPKVGHFVNVWIERGTECKGQK